MKSILLVLIFCIACTQAPIKKRVSHREHDGFMGNVKSVRVEWSPVSGSDLPAGSRCRQMTDVYDESGRLVRHSIYAGTCGADEIREDYTYAQDESRTKTRQELRAKDSSPRPGPAAVNSEYDEDEGQPKTVFKYDASGKLIEAALVKPSGRIAAKSTYSYDAQGRMIATTEDDGVKRVYSYSGDQRAPSGFTYVGRNGKVYERISYSDYEFNSHNDWIKRKETSEETFNRRTVSWTFREIEYYPSGK
jgi:YD repeat-containing protein